MTNCNHHIQIIFYLAVIFLSFQISGCIQESGRDRKPLLEVEKIVYSKGWKTICKSWIYKSGEFVTIEYNIDQQVISEIRGELPDNLIEGIVKAQIDTPDIFRGMDSNGVPLYRFSIDDNKIVHPQAIEPLIKEGGVLRMSQ